jgi:hypothetical protein
VELTGVPLDKELRGAELGGSQVNFTRPQLSPCLAQLTDKAAPAYQEALAIIRAGVQQLAKTPRADMPGCQLTSPQDICRQARLNALAGLEAQMRQAVRHGEKRYEKQHAGWPDQLAP